MSPIEYFDMTSKLINDSIRKQFERERQKRDHDCHASPEDGCPGCESLTSQ